MANIEKTVSSIVEIIGKDNIASVDSCITRLRMTLRKSLSSEMKSRLEKTEGILGVNDYGNDIQVVVGTEVESYKKKMLSLIRT